MTSRPFADAVLAYAQAGWPAVLPVPVVDKHPPPIGYTGEEGRDTDPGQLAAWLVTHADWSIAIRMPVDVIGIDVDHYLKPHTCTRSCPPGCPGYVDKRGDDTLRGRIDAWGPLPPTWASTARGYLNADGVWCMGPSRILFYRVPPQRYATKIEGSIEIIQRHHRYAVVWPSLNPDAEFQPYRWYDPTGRRVDAVPKPLELPELPAAWVAALREGASAVSAAAAPPEQGRALLGALLADTRYPCAEMANAAGEAVRRISASDQGTRHDTTTERTHHIVQLGAAGHPGAGGVLAALAELWARLTSGEGREDEFQRMLLTSARKAVTAVGARPVDRDPCLMIGAMGVLAPGPVDERPPDPNAPAEPLEPIEPPRQLHPLEIIGTHQFDPAGALDQTLADAVLARVQPILRYAPDARVWLLRGPETWAVHADLSGWAVALLADLMPLGDPDAEKGSDAARQAERRKRFMTASTARGFGSKMRDRVAGGAHPNCVELAQLDREPWLLWAGGVCFDLRGSSLAPHPAQVDPGTPHQHSAGTTPDVRPTPLWDAFLAAVWPDPALRAWALRVLSIAVTGYSDKALPVLMGHKDRGKTQVIALLMSVLGTYAHAADPRLLGGADKAHASIIYALKGRRLSFIDEGPREGRLGQERLKQLTGGGELTGNAMNANPITWVPTHTLVLTCNEEPVLTDPAVRGRVRLIPCEGDPEQVIAARAAIGHPQGRAWRREAPGVLAMMMREAAAWLADPTSSGTAAAPMAYRFKAEELAAEQDIVAQWLEEETEPSEAGTRSRLLYEAFVLWTRNGGLPVGRLPSETKWGRDLTNRGYPARHTMQGKNRPLKLRQQGWLPTAQPVMPPTSTQLLNPQLTPKIQKVDQHDGLEGRTDGLMTGLGPTRQPPTTSHNMPIDDGLTGRNLSETHVYAHTHALREPGEKTLQPAIPVKPVMKITGKAGAARQAARAQAIIDAAGPEVSLPCVVTRAGEITPLPVAAAGGRVAELILETGALTVDVEHSGYPVGHADHELRTVQLGNAGVAVVFDPADPAQHEVARIAIAAAPRLHAHSATADLVPLAAAGLTDESAWERMHDTVIPAKLGDPASTGSDPELKKISLAMLGADAVSPGANEARAAMFKVNKWLTDVDPDTPIERSGWAQVNSRCSTMIRYAACDVLDTAALVPLLPALPDAVLERERAVQRITARVAHRGLRIDGDHVARLHAEHGEAKAQASERVQAFGIENPGSDPQVARAIMARGGVLPMTKPSTRHPNGQPSVAAAALEALRGNAGEAGALVDAVLAYRHHETVLSTFLGPYRELVTRGDGRARPTVYTLGTDTGRMSCVRPNLQQLPRVGGVRACITADPGYVLISADFSSVEVRVMAALSGDPDLARMLAEGIDLHWSVARQVWGPDATKADRYTAKRGVFGWAYGGGIPGLARQIGVSESVMAAVVDSLRLVAPGYVAWADSLKTQVRRGAVHMPTYSGRIIHLPKEYPHKGPNYAVQGTARELLCDSLLRWDGTQYGGGVVLPVHDEILAVVAAEHAQAATATLVECMTSQLYGIPIVAEPSKPAFAWQDAA